MMENKDILRYTPSLTPLFQNGCRFRFDMRHATFYMHADDPQNEEAHIHSACEMYVNLSGDVAFAVENKLYPIKPGDIIITKPNEVHRCVYKSDCVHDHYCFWFYGDPEESDLLDCFYNRENGEENRICMSPENKKELLSLCASLHAAYVDRGKQVDVSVLSRLFTLLNLLSDHRHEFSSDTDLPDDLRRVLDYIQDHYSAECGVADLCNAFFISPSTLNRRFRSYLNTTPALYVESCRLACSKRLLEDGESVQNACMKSGFPDYSHFIALFKKHFGVTPLKYAHNHHAHFSLGENE